MKFVGFEVLENECIWSKAGGVNFRACDNTYDCNTCPFDTGLQNAMGGRSKKKQAQKASVWSADMGKTNKSTPLTCRHALTGHIDAPKLCANNYECHHCEYDQWLYEIELSESLTHFSGKPVSGFRMAEDCYYHPGHTWARFKYAD